MWLCVWYAPWLQLCLRLCGSQHVVCPPLPIGPPPGEVSLQPLLEVMQPDSLVGLFAAVLLEQRVLLRVSLSTAQCMTPRQLSLALASVVQLADMMCQLVLSCGQLHANSTLWQCSHAAQASSGPALGVCLCLYVFRLQSRHHWLLTVAAEGVVRLLYPLKYQHVYIPVMPSSLADYLEVRLMSLVSSCASLVSFLSECP